MGFWASERRKGSLNFLWYVYKLSEICFCRGHVLIRILLLSRIEPLNSRASIFVCYETFGSTLLYSIIWLLAVRDNLTKEKRKNIQKAITNNPSSSLENQYFLHDAPKPFLVNVKTAFLDNGALREQNRFISCFEHW